MDGSEKIPQLQRSARAFAMHSRSPASHSGKCYSCGSERRLQSPRSLQAAKRWRPCRQGTAISKSSWRDPWQASSGGASHRQRAAHNKTRSQAQHKMQGKRQGKRQGRREARRPAMTTAQTPGQQGKGEAVSSAHQHRSSARSRHPLLTRQRRVCSATAVLADRLPCPSPPRFSRTFPPRLDAMSPATGFCFLFFFFFFSFDSAVCRDTHTHTHTHTLSLSLIALHHTCIVLIDSSLATIKLIKQRAGEKSKEKREDGGNGYVLGDRSDKS